MGGQEVEMEVVVTGVGRFQKDLRMYGTSETLQDLTASQAARGSVVAQISKRMRHLNLQVELNDPNSVVPLIENQMNMRKNLTAALTPHIQLTHTSRGNMKILLVEE